MVRVSVVIPVHNSATTVEETVASVAAAREQMQGYELEVVAIDDASRDASATVVVGL